MPSLTHTSLFKSKGVLESRPRPHKDNVTKKKKKKLRYDFKYIKPRYFLSQILNHVEIGKKKDEYHHLLVRISTSSVITSSNAYALRKKHFWLTQLLNTASVCHIHFENCAVCMDKHKGCRWYTDQLIFPDMFWVLSILPRLL